MSKSRSCVFSALAVAAGVLLASPVQAQTSTATTTMSVTLTITAGCTVSATAMSFGTVQVLGSNIDVTATVSPLCTNTTPYTVSLNAGGGAGATVAARKMTGPASATVTYALYRDAARTQVWGATVGTDTVAGTGTGIAQPITVYGRIPPQASSAPGAYADVVTATVTY